MINRKQFLQGIVALFVAPKMVAAKPKTTVGLDLTNKPDVSAVTFYSPYKDLYIFPDIKFKEGVFVARKKEHIDAMNKLCKWDINNG